MAGEAQAITLTVYVHSYRSCYSENLWNTAIAPPRWLWRLRDSLSCEDYFANTNLLTCLLAKIRAYLLLGCSRGVLRDKIYTLSQTTCTVHSKNGMRMIDNERDKKKKGDTGGVMVRYHVVHYFRDDNPRIQGCRKPDPRLPRKAHALLCSGPCWRRLHHFPHIV